MEKDLKYALKVLRNGGIILYPTDTIPGIGCDATCRHAVERLFRIKERPTSKSMISLVDSIETLHLWLYHCPEKAVELIENEVRPLTVILDSPKGLAPNLLAPDGSAAFRIPKNDFCTELCRQFGKPIVSTSANLSGTPAPSNYNEIDAYIFNHVDHVCNFTIDNEIDKIPSKIIKITDSGKVSIIRE